MYIYTYIYIYISYSAIDIELANDKYIFYIQFYLFLNYLFLNS